MFKVLLVDDDAIIRMKLRNITNWETLNCEISGEASNGRDAINIINQERPDIVITDIKMPIVNGIELINYIMDTNPNVVVIALSAFDDFEYVKDSLKSGAHDYILKHQITEEVLRKSIKSKIDHIDSPSHERGYRTEQKAVLKKFFIMLLTGFLEDKEEIIVEMNKLNVNWIAEDTIVSVAQLDNKNFRLRDESDYKIMSHICDIIKKSFDNYEFYLTNIGNRLLFVISIKNHKNYLRTFSYTQDIVEKYMNASISFGVSDVCQDIMMISEYYEQACRNLDNGYYQGQSSFVKESSSAEGYNRKIVVLSLDEEKRIKNALFDSSDELIRFFEARFDAFHREGYSSEDLQMYYIELLNFLIREIQERELDEKMVFHQCESPFDLLKECKTLMDVKGFFLDAFLRMNQAIYQLGDCDRYKDITRMAIKYINNNYANGVQLNDIAKELSINSSYLCRIFKEDTGTSITEYNNMIRLQKAVHLIEEGELSLKQIAREVGFVNYNYFYMLFKSKHNISPSQYAETKK